MTSTSHPTVPALKRLFGYLKSYWGMGLMAILAMAMVAVSEAAIPGVLKPVMDNGFSGQDPWTLWYVPTGVVVLAVFRAMTQYASNYMLSWVSNRVLLDLRVKMFERLLHAPASFYQRETTSTLINQIVFEVNQVLGVLTTVLITLVRDSLTVIGLLSYLFYLNWRLTLVIAIILPIIGFLVSKINRRLRRLNREQQTLTNALSYVVKEAVAGYKVVKIHNGEAYEQERFDSMTSRLRGYAMRVSVSGGLAQPITQILASLALAVIITVAMLQSASGTLTVGGFTAFVTAMLLVVSPLKHLIDVNQPLQRGITAAELIFQLIDTEIESTGGTLTFLRAQGRVTFNRVSFYYDFADMPILDNITLDVKVGEMIALVGPSGSGKTTLVNLLPRFFDPTQGQIFLDDIPLTELHLANLRHQISFVSQDVVLFNDTVAANVAYGQSIDMARVQSALVGANLANTVDAMPDGVHTFVGDNGMRLSGGQRQRLAIARAIYKDAPILILDEATSALDSESERYVQTALERLMEGRTTLVIAHRLSTIERADRIIVLERGRIVEQGSHHQLLANDSLYAHLHRIQYSQKEA
ncbi:lipid A export permease/ATP-binding protein MsbA [Candidatus Pandoraea novymonadis]|nr:lipid A export permease/ATP-binding protein MsbA [Candidatus Pandoraea novymonadis]